jgi:anti-sigma B factor antagonist
MSRADDEGEQPLEVDLRSGGDRDNGCSMPGLELSESELRPDCRVIAVAGELDLAVAGQLESALSRIAGIAEVLIDLSACEFLDSTGLALLVNTRNAMRDEGRRLAAFAPSPQVARLIEVTGLAGNGLIFATLEEARAATG